MSQLDYSLDQPTALEGQLADSGFTDKVSKENAAAVPFGLFLTKDTGDKAVKLPAAAADITDPLKRQGVALAHQALESSASGDPTYPAKSAVNVLRKGRVWVAVEEDVSPTDPVYVRYANGVAVTDGTQDQKGAFRKSPDGVAQVATLTPTAANDTLYSISLFDAEGKLVKTVQILSGGAATATEICDALRTALGAITGYTFGGTSTLTITAAVAGEGFSVQSNGPGVIAVAATTPNSQSAAKLSGARWLNTADASDGDLALLEVTL